MPMALKAAFFQDVTIFHPMRLQTYISVLPGRANVMSNLESRIFEVQPGESTAVRSLIKNLHQQVNLPLCQMIQRRKPLRQQERRLKRRARSNPKRQVLRHCSHRTYSNTRIRHGPLRRSSNTIVETILVGVVAAVSVC